MKMDCFNKTERALGYNFNLDIYDSINIICAKLQRKPFHYLPYKCMKQRSDAINS